MDSQAQDRPGAGGAGFAGLRVIAFESRMAREAAALIERNGGVAIVAPSMRELPLDENPQALEFAERLLGGRIDVVIFLTGVGTRALLRVIETRHPRATIAAALTRVLSVARGPKPVAALREIGLAPTIAIAEPNTWREVLGELAARVNLTGRRVAVQEYGVSNPDLIAGLEARGAEVTERAGLSMDTAARPCAAARRAQGDCGAAQPRSRSSPALTR